MVSLVSGACKLEGCQCRICACRSLNLSISSGDAPTYTLKIYLISGAQNSEMHEYILMKGNHVNATHCRDNG